MVKSKIDNMYSASVEKLDGEVIIRFIESMKSKIN